MISKYHKRGLLPPVLSGSTLKWIALLTMLTDHIGAVILECGIIQSYNQHLATALSYEASLLAYQTDRVLRQIGRIAFPIFCFLLVEGFFHTSNRKKYALRLFLFALISEIPFDLCFRGTFLEFSYQNVMFTLLFGFLTIWGIEQIRRIHPALCLVPAFLGLLAGYLFHADYNWKGIVLILVLYLFYFYPLEKTIAGCLALLWEPVACLAFIPINLYNFRKGKGIKYFFYLFYPAHLLLLYLIRYAIFQI
nr:TraX family protein [uncultured Blautia sp.]